VSGRQIEQLVDELTLFTNIIAAGPPRLPLPDHVHYEFAMDKLIYEMLRWFDK